MEEEEEAAEVETETEEERVVVDVIEEKGSRTSLSPADVRSAMPRLRHQEEGSSGRRGHGGVGRGFPPFVRMGVGVEAGLRMTRKWRKMQLYDKLWKVERVGGCVFSSPSVSHVGRADTGRFLERGL